MWIISVTSYLKPPFLMLLGFPQFFYEVFKNIIIAHKL